MMGVILTLGLAVPRFPALGPMFIAMAHRARPAMREVLIGNHMPASKAEMAAYSDELEAVADGFEAAKTEYIEGQCSGSGASAIWGNSDSAVADCVAFSVCQDWDQTDDVNDCAALSNFPECEARTAPPAPPPPRPPHAPPPNPRPAAFPAITPTRFCAPETHTRARCDPPGTATAAAASLQRM